MPGSFARPERDVYSVSRLNREVRVLLERGFGTLWLEAEISNFSRPSSGHWYFSPEGRRRPGALRDVPAAKYAVCVHRPRRPESAGAGAHRPVRAARRIPAHRRSSWRMPASAPCSASSRSCGRELAAEGLFAAERKRPLPDPAQAHRRDHLAHRAPPCATSCTCWRGAFPRPRC